MFKTVSSREIQRDYKSLFAEANRENRPIIVMSHNEPQGAIIGVDLLEKIRLEAVLNEAIEEHKAGKTTKISSREDLRAWFEEMRKDVVGDD